MRPFGCVDSAQEQNRAGDLDWAQSGQYRVTDKEAISYEHRVNPPLPCPNLHSSLHLQPPNQTSKKALLNSTLASPASSPGTISGRHRTEPSRNDSLKNPPPYSQTSLDRTHSDTLSNALGLFRSPIR
ncbi:LOW QUALITY PROTEIN: hypothetical protein OSB04_026991 [Centaurea solstitialis]|uniref:Uncharacterized protein n=1 Tax=Centaurea solstitialis TaxID=347529 RepID=A0AA38W6E3_9ASTR|nr:LOW QUALITY PROTEIN: hypothetical protein OSB04_026991 [Centaurea solstitialis]